MHRRTFERLVAQHYAFMEDWMKRLEDHLSAASKVG